MTVPTRRTRRMLVTSVSVFLLALGPTASAQVSLRPEYRNVVAKARESAWKAIGSGQGVNPFQLP